MSMTSEREAKKARRKEGGMESMNMIFGRGEGGREGKILVGEKEGKKG